MPIFAGVLEWLVAHPWLTVVIVLLYLAFGYRIAIESLRLIEDIGGSAGFSALNPKHSSTPLYRMLFPTRFISCDINQNCLAFMISDGDTHGLFRVYVAFHMFFWPVRFIWNILVRISAMIFDLVITISYLLCLVALSLYSWAIALFKPEFRVAGV